MYYRIQSAAMVNVNLLSGNVTFFVTNIIFEFVNNIIINLIYINLARLVQVH